MIDYLPGLIAQAESISLRFTRLGSLTEWWQCFAWVRSASALRFMRFGCIAAKVRRDFRVLWLLLWPFLRLSAFAGILFFYFKLERRFERQLVKNSRVVLHVDTSQSMGLRDLDASGKEGPARIEPVVEVLQTGKWLEQLRRQHDVAIYRFDDAEKPVGNSPCLPK